MTYFFNICLLIWEKRINITLLLWNSDQDDPSRYAFVNTHTHICITHSILQHWHVEKYGSIVTGQDLPTFQHKQCRTTFIWHMGVKGLRLRPEDGQTWAAQRFSHLWAQQMANSKGACSLRIICAGLVVVDGKGGETGNGQHWVNAGQEGTEGPEMHTHSYT